MPHCTPNFIPSGIGCTMPTSTETKARLLAGGTLFRSAVSGADSNSISLSNNWQVGTAGMPGTYVDYVLGAPINTVVATRLRISINGVQVDMIDADLMLMGSPPMALGSPQANNGINGLRAQLNTLSGSPPSLIHGIVVMPEIDVQIPVMDGNHLAEFSDMPLTGGSGISNSPTQGELDAIRTGPFFTLSHITESEEDGNPLNNGSSVAVNNTRYWNGACWVPFDTINAPDSCAPFGSPPICP